MQENVPLKNYTTLRLGGIAQYFAVCKTEEDIMECIDFARNKSIRVFPLGGGSNIVVSDDISPMFCLKLENKGIEIIDDTVDSVYIKVCAGEIWDDLVFFAVEHNFSGIEMLSAIPGTVGASPIQNIGAYGGEVSQTIQSVRGYNLNTNTFEILSNADCHFGYRNSIFKCSLKGKFIIESVIFKLSKSVPQLPQYPLVDTTLALVQSEFPNASLLQNIRTSIQRIRANKLPDPRVVANVGSFFKNVFVDSQTHARLVQSFPTIPFFQSGEKYKIPAGWLIEAIGFRGYVSGGVGVYNKNALVLINHFSEKTTDLLSLASSIQLSVKEKFGLELEIEPEIIS
jgi:UDP-N-acetylmuramate dehydrogenase